VNSTVAVVSKPILDPIQIKTYVDMPNALPDIIATRAGTSFCSTFASELDPSVLFEIPNTFREQTRSHEIEEACRDDEEDLQGSFVTSLVD
jgi:hypothetical protein